MMIDNPGFKFEHLLKLDICSTLCLVKPEGDGAAMAYLNRQDRRDAILAAAIAVIERDGFAEMTTRAVAAELGAANGIIHHHFASAQALRREAFARFYAAESAAFDQRSAGLAPAAALRLMLADPLDDHGSRMRFWLGAWNEAQRDGDFAGIYAQAFGDMHRRLAGLIADWQAATRPASRAIDAGAAAWRLLVLGHGLAGLAVTPLALVDAREGQRLFARAVEAELGVDLAASG